MKGKIVNILNLTWTVEKSFHNIDNVPDKRVVLERLMEMSETKF